MRLEAWDDYVAQRYQPGKAETAFRAYSEAPAGVKELYRLNHEGQTLDFVRSRHAEYLPLRREATTMWEALERLNELVDDSDPDTDLPQIAHALQTAEKARADGKPDWMQLVGLIHDAGKMLCFWGEPQWAVVGDTFPVGCAFSDKIVYPEYFAGNPDVANPLLSSEMGIYEAGCGLDNVLLAWGHDEYIYQVLRDSKMPAAGLAMLRYHSFYPWHREGAYARFMDASDREKLFWVREFNQYDLYSKGDAAPDVAALKPYYQRLIDKYLPAAIQW
ncbi:MAG: inositol oxygenase [Acidobacteria bacterium]|nr:inositol oxygenase [Acidobacteriota bacterium]